MCVNKLVLTELCQGQYSLTLLAPGFWVLVIPRGGAQSAHTQFKGSKWLFDLKTLCVLSEIYIDFTRKKKWSKSQKVSYILRFENVLDLRLCHDLNHENRR